MADLLMLGSRLGIGADPLALLCDGVVQEWTDWGRLLNVNTSALPPFSELLSAPQAPAFAGGEDLAPTPPGQGLRVLVVDDDGSMRKLIKMLLTRVGHECLEAENGRIALDIALETPIDLMIVDWLMPEMSGIELIRSLRQTDFGKGIYILIHTAMDQEDRLVEAFEAGADDFLSKPMKPRILAARLRAGQRVVMLQREIERDQSNLQRFSTELALLNRRIQESRLVDSVTELGNRPAILEWLRHNWADGGDMTAILIKLDGLADINQTHGRQAGDEALRRVANLLRGGMKSRCQLGRYGDSQFLVLCTHASQESARAAADKLRLAIASRPLPTTPPCTLNLRTSVAVRSPAIKSVDHLLSALESALAGTA
jgi:diguanylate cyclase (GGDEF)-like protein